MTKAEKFQALAKRLVLKFTDGKYVYKQILTEDYDTHAGLVTRTFNDITDLDCARTRIKDEDNKDDMTSDSHFFVTVAGVDMPVEPTIGDVIQIPDGTFHRIDSVVPDQYRAAFKFYVSRALWV